jgi:hypothetical protein
MTDSKEIERIVKAIGGSSRKRTFKRVLITGLFISNSLKRSSNKLRHILERSRQFRGFLRNLKTEISYVVVTRIVNFTAPISNSRTFA